uniref:Uncharacterized protein n=1 Tax=Glossina austeni TaxID=7395 RepID=A0A1A9VCD2_GLOAU
MLQVHHTSIESGFIMQMLLSLIKFDLITFTADVDLMDRNIHTFAFWFDSFPFHCFMPDDIEQQKQQRRQQQEHLKEVKLKEGLAVQLVAWLYGCLVGWLRVEA